MEWMYVWFLVTIIILAILLKFVSKYDLKVTILTSVFGGLTAVVFNTVITNFTWRVVVEYMWPMFMTGAFITFIANTLARLFLRDT